MSNDRQCPLKRTLPDRCVEGLCAWWDRKNECCACLTFMTAGDKQGSEYLQMMLRAMGDKSDNQ